MGEEGEGEGKGPPHPEYVRLIKILIAVVIVIGTAAIALPIILEALRQPEIALTEKLQSRFGCETFGTYYITLSRSTR